MDRLDAASIDATAQGQHSSNAPSLVGGEVEARKRLGDGRFESRPLPAIPAHHPTARRGRPDIVLRAPAQRSDGTDREGCFDAADTSGGAREAQRISLYGVGARVGEGCFVAGVGHGDDDAAVGLDGGTVRVVRDGAPGARKDRPGERAEQGREHDDSGTRLRTG